LTFYISGQILSWTRNICNENLTRTIKLIGSSWFLLLLLLPRQICNSLYRDCASTRNKTLYTLTCYLLPISIVPRHSYSSQNLYQDGKNHAVPSLHRDSFLAKEPGPCPVLRQVTPTNFIAGPLGTINANFNIHL
jgi:hypothetical protein